MFCPNCGEKENQLVQYCRTCGTDLRAVREGLERPDREAASIASAREEIARAAAAKIKEGDWWQVGAIAPEVEKLFESSQERHLRHQREDEQQRLRLLRGGTIATAVGLGMILLFLLLSLAQKNVVFLVGPSLIVFLVGLGVIINGLFFTIHKRTERDRSLDKQKREIPDGSSGDSAVAPRALSPEQASFLPLSVTEQTTRNLSGELVDAPTRSKPS